MEFRLLATAFETETSAYIVTVGALEWPFTSFLWQGNRVSTEEDLEQVILSPSGLQALALYAHFQASLPFQQVVGDLSQRGHVLGPCSFRTRFWSFRKVTSVLQSSEFSMLQCPSAAANCRSADVSALWRQ